MARDAARRPVIGGVPDAVLAELTGHKELSIWSEMISDGVISLVESGVVTNRKATHPGRCTVGFACGSSKLYSWLDDKQARIESIQPSTNIPLTPPPLTATSAASELSSRASTL